MEKALLEKIKSKEIVAEALKLAEAAHKGQTRKTGEDYIEHPKRVVMILHSWGADDETLAAGYLHDVVEDTNIALKEIREKFGERVAFLVDGVTKKGNGYETFKKVQEYSSKDKRVLLIKLADRIHNISTPLPGEEWKIKYKVSTSLYIRLGRELGFDSMCDELEELVNKNLN